VCRIVDWRRNYHSFIGRELGVAEGILAVALLENTFVADSLGGEDVERAVLEDWRILLRLIVVSVFIVAKNDDAGLGTIWFAVLIYFDDKDTYRG